MPTFRTLRSGLGLTQAETATLCGVSRRSVIGWEDGSQPVHLAAARLLWACQRDPTLMEALRAADQRDVA